MGRIALEPKGAALTTPKDFVLVPDSPKGLTTGCEGRKGAKCALTPMGPTPLKIIIIIKCIFFNMI